MTYRERFESRHPELDGTGILNYMMDHCPVITDDIPCYCQSSDSTPDECNACWNREIPETPITNPEPVDPTPILDEAINPLHITFYPANIPNPDEMLANLINTASAIKDRPVYITVM